jgi:S-formylglutathione hydrolase FrmB
MWRVLLLKRTWFLTILLLCACVLATAQRGEIKRIKVHGFSLEGNLIGEPTDRDVSIYLPPSYGTALEKRYPVLYLLHGINDTDEDWTSDPHHNSWETIQGLMDYAIQHDHLAEMIIVMPNERTSFMGSFYTNSEVTGHWEDFTAVDLVHYVDETFRTIARREHRVVAGHSMGGYGTLKLVMKHADVFSAGYAMSPAAFEWVRDWSPENPAFRSILDMQKMPELKSENIYPLAIICTAQAFSPDPKKPPFYADFPFRLDNGRLIPNGAAFQRFEGEFPINLAEKYAGNLRSLTALRLDAGKEDQYPFIPQATIDLSDRLTSLGVPHQMEIYNGDHRNRLWGKDGRILQQVLPFFSRLFQQ